MQILKIITKKNETVYINAQKILFYYPFKDCIRIELEDGTVFEAKEAECKDKGEFGFTSTKN